MSPGSRCVVRVSERMSVCEFVSKGLSVLIAGALSRDLMPTW